jgi:hypothetical protein
MNFIRPPHSIQCVNSPHKIIVALCSGRLCNMFLLTMVNISMLSIFCLAMGGEDKHRKTCLFVTKGSSKNWISLKICLFANFKLAPKSLGK